MNSPLGIRDITIALPGKSLRSHFFYMSIDTPDTSDADDVNPKIYIFHISKELYSTAAV